MLLGIDHVVIAVADLDASAERVRRALGLVVSEGGSHPGLGTSNRLVWLGDTYLELLGIADPEIAAGSWIGAPALEALRRGGGLGTWAVATDALDTDLRRLRERGSGLADPVPGERRRPDGAVVRWRLAAPRHLGPGEPPFLIEHAAGSAEWTLGERAARAGAGGPLGVPARLAVLELAVEDVHRVGLRFSRALGLRFRPSLTGAGARDADVGSQIVRLRPRRGEPASATLHVLVAGSVRQDLELLGCRWLVRPGAAAGRAVKSAVEEGT